MYSNFTKDYRKVFVATRSIILICIAFVSACSSPTPGIVAKLNKISIPAIQPSAASAKPKQETLSSLYLKNRKEINRLNSYLKDEYLHGINKNDIFDVNSPAHQVYDSLTKLEQAKLVNEQYFQDGNYEGLVKLSNMLRPFETERSSK